MTLQFCNNLQNSDYKTIKLKKNVIDHKQSGTHCI